MNALEQLFQTKDYDIVVSHGPPSDVFDRNSRGENVGCSDLRAAIEKRSSLKAIVFGHVHHSHGACRIGNQWFINAAQFNGIYQNDILNLPYEIQMRRNKSIRSVDHVIITTDLETQNK